MGLMPFKGEAPTKPGMTQPDSAAPQRDPERYVQEGEPNVTPEEQAQYDAFVKNAMRVIYAEGQVRPEVLDSLRIETDAQPEPGHGPSPAVLALANAAVQIVSKLDDSAREANQPITDDILLHGGIAVIEELAEIAGTAKIHDYTEDEMGGALTVAVDMYRPKAIQDGRTTEDDLKGQFDQAVQADKEGRLGEMIPGAGAMQRPEEGA